MAYRRAPGTEGNLNSSVDDFRAGEDAFLYQDLPNAYPSHPPPPRSAGPTPLERDSFTSSLNDHAVPMGEKPYRSPPLGSSTDRLTAPSYAAARRGGNGKAGWSTAKKWTVALIALAAIALAVGIPVAIVSNKNGKDNKNANAQSDKDKNGASSTPSSDGNAATATTTSDAAKPTPTTGADGSMVTSLDGTQTFKYNNTNAGFWVSTPFDDSAQAQSDTPALKDAWDYSKNRIRGVNLGGWLNLEGFIVPGVFEPYVTAGAIDEWTLAQILDLSGPTAKADVLEKHFASFITEFDFAQIAGAGLNWVRLPIPFWALEVYPGEPYYMGKRWDYVLKAISWARRYGIRINLDLHTCPGSQNGWDHSGRRSGKIQCMVSAMGLANGQRALNHVRVLAQFISQPQYKNVVPMFGIMNEPMMTAATQPAWESWYTKAYQDVRAIGGNGAGNGPVVLIHDGFLGQGQWTTFLTGADRLALDTHTYLCFNNAQNNNSLAAQATSACTLGPNFRTVQSTWGLNTGGEWSLAINDCGLSVNGIGAGNRYAGTFAGGPTTAVGTCDEWTNADLWSAERNAGMQTLAVAWMSALHNFFFWTWKIGPLADGSIPNPMWSYQLGLQKGYMPPDAVKAVNGCAGSPADWAGTLPASAVGAGGAGALDPAVLASYPWPPSISAATLYTYTATAPIFSMPVSAPAPTSGGKSYDAGTGWFNTADAELFYTPAAAVAYPGAWGITGETILKKRSEGEAEPLAKREPLVTATPAPAPRPRARHFK